MSSDIISGARKQLESALNVVLKELGTRNARELEKQLDEACTRLKSTQKGIEASVSELLKTEVAGTLLSFGQTMEDLAQDSVGRWRHALGKDLNSVAKILGGQFRLEAASGSNGNKDGAGLLRRETAAVDYLAFFGHCASFGNARIIGSPWSGLQSLSGGWDHASWLAGPPVDSSMEWLPHPSNSATGEVFP